MIPRLSLRFLHFFFAVLLQGVMLGSALSQTAPPDFLIEDAFPTATFNLPTLIVFMPDGRKLVVEKEGRIWVVTASGAKLSTPFINLSAKVLSNDDRGLHGVVLDPDFATNRWVYLLYTVDPDSNGNDNNIGAFARLERYQVSSTNPNVLDLSTEQILIGANWALGIPEPPTNMHHMVGTLRFAADKTLMVGSGDAANAYYDAGGTDPLTSYGPGKTDPSQDIGAFRAQTLNSMNGKILRVDKETGNGLPSNPYWDGNPTASRSRVWVYGLRNPFRFSIRPGTGSTDPTAGQPGVLYIGDVGWNTTEELDIARQGGTNFGWPCFEGAYPQPQYQAETSTYYPNPNVLCSASLSTENPRPKTLPVLWWDHANGTNSNPPGLVGNCSIGGVFYTGISYPASYQNRYYIADYGRGWIKSIQVDANDNVISINNFIDGGGGIVDIEADPATGDLYYIDINISAIKHVRYVTGNRPPIVNASVVPTSGYTPLTVTATASGSTDPDGDILSYVWTFGDGGTAHRPDTSYTYTTAGTYTAIVTVTDIQGSSSIAAFQVVPGQVPPPGNILQPITNTFFNQNQSVSLQATAADPAQGPATYRWDIDLHHNNHFHFSAATYFGQTASFIPSTPNDGEQYSLRIRLAVTQGALTSLDTANMYPRLNLTPVAISFNPATPGANSAFQVITRIRSVGEVGSSVSTFEVREGSLVLASGTLNPIRNGDSLEVAATIGPLALGQHTITVVVDPANNLFETNETDNEITGVVTVAGLIAAYSFDQGTGTTLTDVSGHGLTGTISGATWTATGKYGKALSFNGTDNYVDLGNPALLQITGSMTWSAWVNASGNPVDDGQIIAKSDDNSGWQFKSSPDITPHTFGVAVSASLNAHTQRYSSTTRALNTWYHVAGVYDATAQTLDIYVNGVLNNGALVGIVPSSQFDATFNVNIGRRAAGFYFNGIIDEVRIYNRALTQAEIQSDMNTPLGAPPPPPAPPVLATPANGATGVATNPTLTWNASTGATSYRVQVSTDAGFASTVADQSNIITTSYAASGLVSNTQYYWHVNASNGGGTSSYSTAASFTTGVPPPPPAPPALATPANGATGIATNPTLTWNASTGATSYRVQVSTDAAFAIAIVDQSNITTTSYVLSSLVAGTTYYWHVNATNSGGTSSYSTASNFTTVTLPTPPVLATPANAATGVATNPTLTWNASTGAASYRVQVSTSSGFATTVADQSNITTTSLALSGLASGTTYYWHVNATNSGGTSAYSAASNFTTVALPTPPVLATPANAATGVATNPTLTWNASTGATSYRVQVSTNSGFTALIVDQSNVATTSYGLSGLLFNTTYYWRVNATNSAGTSAYSTSRNFKTNLPVGLVAAYAFDAGIGTTAVDASGHTLTGTIVGATWTTQGKYGNALSFDGTTSYVNLGNPTALRITGSLTWSAWVKAAANPTDDGEIIAKANNSAGWQLKTTLGTGQQTFGIGVSPSSTLLTTRYGTTVRLLGTWYHVAGVYNTAARTLDIYVNGVLENGTLVGTIPASQTNTSANVNIGRRSTGFYFNGIIDEVRIYNRALTQAEIQSDMNTPLTAPPPAPPVPPVLATPSNGATDVVTNPTLMWNASTGATSYRVQLSTDPAFGTTLVDQSNIAATSYAASGLSTSTTYYWRVNAANGGGTSSYSATWSFVTAAPPPPPATPVLATPANGATGITTNPTLTWNASIGATSYHLQVSTSALFGTTVVDQNNIATTSYAAIGLAANTVYHWRVSAANVGGTSAYSTAWDFTTATIPAGLVAAYAFDEGGGTTAADASGTGNFGTTVNTTWTSSGKFGNALVFNGTNAWVVISDSPSLDLTVGMTLEAWVYPFSIPPVGCTGVNCQFMDIVMKDSDRYYVLASSDNNQKPEAGGIFASGKHIIYAPSPLAINTWTHLAVTYGSSMIRFYVNGSLVASATETSPFTTSANPLFIGGDQTMGQYFNGRIDEVRVYNLALTQEQIQTDMSTPLGLPPAPPVLVTPVNGATGVATNPTLTWNASTGAISYHLQVSTDAAFGTTVLDQNNLTTTSYAIASLAGNTAHYWRVSASNTGGTSAYSTAWSFTTAAPPPPPVQPVLATPANGATGVIMNPILTWNASTGAASYRVQVSTDTGFVTTVVDSSNITTTSYSVSGLSANTLYYWHVNATNSGGTSAYSSTSSFTTLTPPPPPPPPVLATPADGATGVATNPTLTWNASAGATAYRVQVSTNSAFTSTILDQGSIATTSFAVNGLTANTTYYWHVNATNSEGTSVYSTAQNFRTVPLPAGLVAAYSFNEGLGTTTADASGNGFIGTISGATWTTQGKYGGALSFNGTTSYVDLGNPVLLQITGSMSWGAWVNAAANPADDGQILAKSDNTSGWQFKTSPDTGPHTFGAAVSAAANSHTQRYSTTVRALNTWYHVAGVYNATARTLDIYVNGVLDNGVLLGTIPASQVNSALNVNIGRRTGGFYFNGIIDEVRIYNRALTQAEIQSDMNTPLGTSGARPVIIVFEAETMDSSVTITSADEDKEVSVHPSSDGLQENVDGNAVRGSATTFRVSALGGDLVSYQWQKDGVDIPGANTSSYTFVLGSSSDVATVRCVVSNSFGADSTGEAVISRSPSRKVLGPGGSDLLANISEKLVPLHYSLEQNFPNPFNPTTTFKYAIPKEGHVRLQVFNVLGELAATLEDQLRAPGYYEIPFDASHLPSGVYIYRIQAGDFIMAKKLLLLR